MRLLRVREICQVSGLARSTLYGEMRRGRFPAPVRISRRSVAWRSTDIDEWLKSRVSTGVVSPLSLTRKNDKTSQNDNKVTDDAVSEL